MLLAWKIAQGYRYVPFQTLKKMFQHKKTQVNSSTTFFNGVLENVCLLFGRLGIGTDICLKTWRLCYYRKQITWKWWLAIEFGQCATWMIVVIKCCWWKGSYQVLTRCNVRSTLLQLLSDSLTGTPMGISTIWGMCWHLSHKDNSLRMCEAH